MVVLEQILNVALTAAPWLLAGLLAAALIKALIPEAALLRWVGGQGLASVSRAAVMGAPLPLCSCGAIPTAFALHRGGAGRGPTTAFLIGTPGIGVDSIAITYALLGPFMLVARATGAVVTAIATGLLVTLADHAPRTRAATSGHHEPERHVDDEAGCCQSNTCGTRPVAAEPDATTTQTSLSRRLRDGLRYAFADLLDDISRWLAAGLVIAGILMALVPPQALAEYGSGLPAMFLMAIVGIPLYLCATAATPIAAGMLVAGVSPGTALVFLLAAPITSMATLAVMRKEMGAAVMALYLLGILVSTVLVGLVADQTVQWLGIAPEAQVGATGELLPTWFEAVALAVLAALAITPLRRRVLF